jgi:hypothetical protein
MAPRQIIVPGAFPSRDANGRALPAKLRFYLPNTAAPATVFSDITLSTPHSWPLISDSAGRWPQIWADDALYFDVAWSDLATDQAIATFEDIQPLQDPVLASIAFVDGAVSQAQDARDVAAQAAADAEALLTAAQAFVAPFGDLSGVVAAAAESAATAVGAAADAAASAAAAEAFAASIDPANIRLMALRLAASL